MYKLAEPLFLKVETPLHAGSGAELGVVDLPIQRERHTGYPKIEGSSLKGSLREAFEEHKNRDKNKKWLDLTKKYPQLKNSWMLVGADKKPVQKKNSQGNGLTEYDRVIWLSFGPDDEPEAHAGALGFTDARLLLLPVKSMKGVFAYVTCPAALKRLQEDLQLCLATRGAVPVDDAFSQNLEKLKAQSEGLRKADLGTVSVSDTDNRSMGQCYVSQDSALKVRGTNAGDFFILLEEYSFKVKPDFILDDLADALAKFLDAGLQLQKPLKEHLVVLHDDDFRDFANLATEVITRIKIDNTTGTVARGQLFTEEYLPCESVLYSLVLTTSIFRTNGDDKGIFAVLNEEVEVMKFFQTGCPRVFQLGGNATIGKGLVRAHINGGAA